MFGKMDNINVASVLLDNTATPHQSNPANQSLAKQVAAAYPPIGNAPPNISPANSAPIWVNPDPVQSFEDSL